MAKKVDRLLTARGVGWLKDCDKDTVSAAVDAGELAGEVIYGPEWEPSALAVKESAALRWKPRGRGRPPLKKRASPGRSQASHR